jgi:hypothetical protein
VCSLSVYFINSMSDSEPLSKISLSIASKISPFFF